MNAGQFAKIVHRLGWTQALVAYYLIRDPRTVRRYLRAETPIPKVVEDAISDRVRLAAFEIWLDTLEKGRLS